MYHYVRDMYHYVPFLVVPDDDGKLVFKKKVEVVKKGRGSENQNMGL